MAIVEPIPSVKPITPKEAVAARSASIPEKVIEIVNESIVSNLSVSGGTTTATVKVKEVKKAILKDSALCDILHQKYPEEAFERAIELIGWLDFESRYRLAGWSVKYHSPDYTQRFDAYYEFSGK